MKKVAEILIVRTNQKVVENEIDDNGTTKGTSNQAGKRR